MAPAAAPIGMPSPLATPINATPSVPTVPQLVPVVSEMIEQITHAVNRKKRGEMRSRP